MRDYRTNVVSFQSSRKFLDNSTETDLKIPIKPPMAEKLEAIARANGTNSVCLAVLAVAHLINQQWDWEKGKPRN